MPPLIDLTGQRFGRLEVIERAGSDKQQRPTWFCKCDCGNTKIIRGYSLYRGDSTSCGCYAREFQKTMNATHGQSRSPLYHVWVSMIQRCQNAKSQAYHNYGARGITVCDEWQSFEQFYTWAKTSGYEEGLTLEREDNDGGYSPTNCKWATPKEQANNRRTNRFVDWNGETHTLKEWAEITGINYAVMKNRISKAHWSVERALTTPVKNRKEQQHECTNLRPVRRRQNSMQHYGDCTEQGKEPASLFG